MPAVKHLAPLPPLEITWEDLLLGGGVAAQFADPTLPLQVEIGPGDDDFLMQRAHEHPTCNWLGIEYSRKRVRRYVRKVQRTHGEPGNLRLLWRPAADVLQPFLSPGRVAAFHVYFPDPWPKAHHARYRIADPAFMAALGECLTEDGLLHMATDARPYAEEIAEVLEATPSLVNLHAAPGFRERHEGAHVTAFERQWREEGREILALDARRRPR